MKSQAKRAALAAFIGTSIEYYDFFTYGFAAALVFGKLFFPVNDPFLSSLAAFATFAIGFIARPLSGAVFGHWGDRLGRKKMLVLTMFLMGAATTAVGLLPTYASVGMAAPVMLIVLRMVQGIAVGGEWGGGILMSTEHAPAHKKIFSASIPQLGTPMGLLLTLLAFRGVSMLSADDFASWGWRLPFLASAPLFLIGMFIRLGVTESPEFADTLKKAKIVESPATDVVKRYWGVILFGAAATAITSGGYFFTNTFMISYVTSTLPVSKSTILSCLLGVTVLQLLLQPFSAALAERIGLNKVIIGATIFCFISPFPMFLLVNTGITACIVFGIALCVVSISWIYALLSSLLVDAFPVELRYSGISISYQLGCAVAGGTTPMLGIIIARAFPGQWIPLACFFAGLSALSLLGIGGLIVRKSGSFHRQSRRSVSADA